MSPEEIITLLKEQYDRETRKQLVKSLIEEEKDKTAKTQAAPIINQIFSYVLKNRNWNITLNSSDWDAAPLHIMKEVFPKIEISTWYKDRELMIDKDIDVLMGK